MVVTRVFVLAVALAAAVPAAASAASLRVSPSNVPAGDVVRVSGSVSGGCAAGSGVTLISGAFNSKQAFAGVPAVQTTAGNNGRFSVLATIPLSRTAGKYAVTGRCGGGNFGSVNLRVNRSAFVSASPTNVPAGHSVRVYGSTRGGCARGDTVTILSTAFSPRRKFAGVPAITARSGAGGAFSVTTVIPVTRAAGSYSLRARCGGGSFGSGRLRVNRSAFIEVSPTSVSAGGDVRVSGSVRNGCARGDTVTLISAAFDPSQTFAGVPAISGPVGSNGSFSVRTMIPASRAAGRYTISGRCGGGGFGQAQLRVR
jgi:hypothetical protein